MAKHFQRIKGGTIMKLNNVDFETYFKNYPDERGYFGKYGGA